jgi:hypothetical protein
MAQAVSGDGRNGDFIVLNFLRRSGWFYWLSKVLLATCVLASAATALILGFLVYLIIDGYSGGNSPTNIAPIAFPVVLLFFVVLGIPALVISALLWFAYGAARTRMGAGRSPGSGDGA